MNLLIDLAQNQAAFNFGFPYHSAAPLICELVRVGGVNQVGVLADPRQPQSFQELREEFIRLLPAGGFKPFFHVNQDKFKDQQDFYSKITAVFARQAYHAFSPDVIFYPDYLERAKPQDDTAPYDQLFSEFHFAANVHDLIPYKNPSIFLDPYPAYKEWYLKRVNTLKQFDLLFVDSDAVRNDLSHCLGIHPGQVIRIDGVDRRIFYHLNPSEAQRRDFLERSEIQQPYLLCNRGRGSDKTFREFLAGYRQLSAAVRQKYRLVVIDDQGSGEDLQRDAISEGLDGELILHVVHSRCELAELYQFSTACIFVSPYEEGGIALQEGVACVDVVIAPRNPGCQEVIGRDDRLFDLGDASSFLEVLQHVLTDLENRDGIPAQAQTFRGLKGSAEVVWQTLEDITAEQTPVNLLSPQRQPADRKATSVSPSKPKIAFVSPLPPQKTGIASYSAELIPVLAEEYDLDLFVDPGVIVNDPYLTRNFQIYPLTELVERRDCYATIIYQIGNSHYHAQMLDLLADVPGVVVLHDFYLGDLKFSANQHTIRNELARSHGLKAMVDFEKRGFALLNDWPINWQVIRHAQEMIVHSGYQNKLVDQYYGKGWKPRLNVVKHIRRTSPRSSAAQRRRVRQNLGIGSGQFVICSFGQISPNKLSTEVIRAFAQSGLSARDDVRLILVGECPAEFTHQIEDLISELRVGKSVRITGYVNREVYEAYLGCTDVSIQLRTKTRGETSGALLDCLAHGIPTIINAHATFNDYEDGVVYKIHDPFDVSELAEALRELYASETQRKELSERAIQSITEENAPGKILKAYSEVITRAIQTDERQIFKPLFEYFRTLQGLVEDQIKPFGECAAGNFGIRTQPRLLLDVSSISQLDRRTGMHRVVRNLILEFFAMNDFSQQIELVANRDGQMVYSRRYAERLFELEKNSLGDENIITLQAGDTLFMLDPCWSEIDAYLPIFDQVRSLGGRILTLVHDLIPLRHPETCHESVLEHFEHWFRVSCAESDTIVCVSRAVAEDVRNWIRSENLILPRRLDITNFHPGSDLRAPDRESKIRSDVRAMLSTGKRPMFLMVGTLEARKNHSFVLDAFELIWRQGYDFTLCIMGQKGWKAENTIKRIGRHPELNRRMIFIDNPTDAELNLAYQNATALIIASIAEGFGLPIVEAAQHHVPILASDIPVFHEVGGDGILYFSLESPNHLAGAVRKMATLSPKERSTMSQSVDVLTWKESAAWMMQILCGQQDPAWIIQLDRSVTDRWGHKGIA